MMIVSGRTTTTRMAIGPGTLRLIIDN